MYSTKLKSIIEYDPLMVIYLPNMPQPYNMSVIWLDIEGIEKHNLCKWNCLTYHDLFI